LQETVLSFEAQVPQGGAGCHNGCCLSAMESTKLFCVTVGLISFLDIFLFAALGLKISLSGQCGWPLRWHCFSRLVARQWAQPIQEMPARQAAMTIFQVFLWWLVHNFLLGGGGNI